MTAQHALNAQTAHITINLLGVQKKTETSSAHFNPTIKPQKYYFAV
jgi:hypothetical protein